ncbi:MAG: hypothetical protein RLZZ362_1340 [Actinomycetota bacterium]
MRRDGADAGSTRRTGTEIEFLAPDSRAFGEATQVDFAGFDGDDATEFDLDEETRSRWLTAVAAIVVLGLVAAGVVAAAPWADDAAAPPPTTVAPPPITVFAPTETTDILQGIAVEPIGWVVDDPPDGFEFSGAWSQPRTGVMSSLLDVWLERPTEPTSGRWVTVQWSDYLGDTLTPDGARVVADGRPAVVSIDADGVTTVRARVVPQGDGESDGVEIRASGVELGLLIDLAGRVQRDVVGVSNSGYGDSGLDVVDATDGLTLAWSGTPISPGLFGAFGDPDAMTGLYGPADGSGIWIELRPVDTTLLALMPILLREVPLPNELARQMKAVGRPATVYAVSPTDDEQWLFATWVDGDEAVTISSYDVDLTTVLATLASTRRAEPDEWVDLIERSQRVISFDEAGPSPSASQQGAFADGTEWTSSFAATFFWIRTGADGWYSPIRIGNGAAVRRYADVDVDVIAATAQWPSPARVMRVTVGGAAPVDVPLVQMGDEPTFAGLFVQREIAPISVELLDAQGEVVPVG